MGETTRTDDGRGPGEEPYGDLELEAMAPDLAPPPRKASDITMILRLSDLEDARSDVGAASSSSSSSPSR